jgi:hypothetical protein
VGIGGFFGRKATPTKPFSLGFHAACKAGGLPPPDGLDTAWPGFARRRLRRKRASTNEVDKPTTTPKRAKARPRARIIVKTFCGAAPASHADSDLMRALADGPGGDAVDA